MRRVQAPEIHIQGTKVSVDIGTSQRVLLSNRGIGDAYFSFIGGPPGSCCPLPAWLGIYPLSGTVPAGTSVSVAVTAGMTAMASSEAYVNTVSVRPSCIPKVVPYTLPFLIPCRS